MPFPPLDQQPDFAALEEAVLAHWKKRDVFARSLQRGEPDQLYSFFEGPPTANGRPGVHHVEARVFKDLYPRYHTMKGKRVPRMAGWDCHGIPVEVEVEKELGFSGKQDIEAYGVAAFNERCRESVRRYVDSFEQLTERIGFWVDTEDAYWTLQPSYIESVWWSLAKLYDDNLIYSGYRVVPYCPRCGTALSDAEVAQGYEQTTDPSVFVRFPVSEGPLAAEAAALLIWTTTPWTLISNTAVAVGEGVRYVLVRTGEELVVMAAELVERVLGEDARIVRDVGLDELRGLHYRAPFDFLEAEPGSDWHYVTVADFVTTSEGTGLVHLAPAFGADDMAVARAHDLPILNPVDTEGRFDERITAFAGEFVKAADPEIISHLRDAGLLHAAEEYTHTYPFCWRCGTPLLYYAKPSWYIATTRLRDRLMEINSGVDWHPEHIRDGRFGDWLRNNVDWALSRERYWGTPLPFWRCETCEDVTAVASLAELGEHAGRDLSQLDPHRPYVDEITFPCETCEGGTKRRVPEVIDAWYDSGAMPFAQFGYPHAEGSRERFARRFPADFICEAIDQTRGWFYSLMAVAALLFDENSYRTVLCLGHLVDADGKKMSKSVGNVIDPFELIAEKGADALRWLLLTEGSPWVSRRVGAGPVDEVVRKFLLTLWNTAYFFTTYARMDGWEPARSHAAPVADRPLMDRWVLAELAALTAAVDAALARYDATEAGRLLSAFADDLSNWYVRRTRPRFWRPTGENDADKDAAFATLHTCLVTLSTLLAPFVPFLADTLYEQLVLSVDESAPDSVHLLDYPTPDPAAADDALRAAMAAARQVVELGRRARNDAQIGVRQPLRRALVTLPTAVRAAFDLVANEVATELNVKAVTLPEAHDTTVRRRLKPNFRALGPSFGKRTPQVAAALEAADAEAVATALEAEGHAELAVDGETVRVSVEQVEVVEEAQTGWQVASDGAYSLALDLRLDAELRREGLARELIRALNDLRKREAFELSQRIAVEVAATGELGEALQAHRESVAREVLATTLERGEADGGHDLEVAGHTARVRLTPVGA